jgi:hypothetical protein
MFAAKILLVFFAQRSVIRIDAINLNLSISIRNPNVDPPAFRAFKLTNKVHGISLARLHGIQILPGPPATNFSAAFRDAELERLRMGFATGFPRRLKQRPIFTERYTGAEAGVIF